MATEVGEFLPELRVRGTYESLPFIGVHPLRVGSTPSSSNEELKAEDLKENQLT